MNSRRWRLEEVDGGRTVSRGGWRGLTVEMNSIPWSPVLRYTTPLSMNRTPISTVVLQHKSVSSVLRYARPFPMNRTPFQPYVVKQKARFLRSAVRQTSFRLFRPS